MKGTCEELYKKGFLKENHYYFQNKYYIACKKFLFFKIKYKVWRQEILEFKGIKEDDYGFVLYVFELVFNTDKKHFIEFPSLTCPYCRHSEINLKKLKRIKCYY